MLKIFCIHGEVCAKLLYLERVIKLERISNFLMAIGLVLSDILFTINVLHTYVVLLHAT